MNIAASRHHARVQCYFECATSQQQALAVQALVEKAPQDTYLRLFGGLQALPVTPNH